VEFQRVKRSLFAELKRRNVFRATILYVGAVWALAQGISQLGPTVGAPEWATRWFLVAAAIGLPLWIAFAWFYEITPEGIKLERDVEPGESITHHTGRKIDFAIIGVLGLAVVLLLTDRFMLRHERDEESVSNESIAVLPFLDLSQAKDQEYFSDGISEELLNLLAKIPELKVAARTSSFSFKGKQIEIPEIARKLHVANVLEGSVRKAGDAVRITAQLIRAADGFHQWSETYDRKLDDVFAIQDEIASDVVKELKVTLLAATPKVRTTDPHAYALYLQAIQAARLGDVEGYAKSDALLRQVLDIDPTYVPAWTGLAANLNNEISLGTYTQQEGEKLAREAAERALAIDPDYASAYARLGWIAMGDDDLPTAAKHLQHGLQLAPTSLDVLKDSAVLLGNLGRLNEALILDAAIVRRDPVNPTSVFNLGIDQRWAGRLDEAIDSFRTVLSLRPGWAEGHYELGVALLQKGDGAAALAEMEQETAESYRLQGLAMAYHAVGRKAESDAALAAYIAKYEKEGPTSVAMIHAFRGEADKVFEWLEKGIAYGDGSGLGETALESLYDPVRSDPRWLPLLRRIGKAPEQLAAIDFKVELPKAEAHAAPKT
jgi:TolB-like protein/Tfp pilus assembly protein PilF